MFVAFYLVRVELHVEVWESIVLAVTLNTSILEVRVRVVEECACRPARQSQRNSAVEKNLLLSKKICY